MKLPFSCRILSLNSTLGQLLLCSLSRSLALLHAPGVSVWVALEPKSAFLELFSNQKENQGLW